MVYLLVLVELDANLSLDVLAVHEDGGLVGLSILVLDGPVLAVLHLLDFYVDLTGGSETKPGALSNTGSA